MVLASLVASIAFATLTNVVMCAWAVRYLQFSTADFLLLAAVGVCVTGVLAVPFFWALRGVIGRVLSWSGEDRTAERATEVWKAAVGLARALALRGIWAGVVALPLVDVPFVVLSGRSATSGLVLALTGAVTVAASLFVIVFSTDLALRPLLRDVAAFVPGEFDPGVSGWRLRTRAFAPLPFMTLYSALTVGAFVDLVARGPLRFALAFGIALATIAITGVIFWVVTRSLLDPIDDLLAATVRVGKGDVATPVPIVTADELGGLAQGFNRMLANLRRHEQHSAAAEEERRRLERDIHDGAQQRLAAVAMWLDGLENRLVRPDQEVERAVARRAADEVREAIEELRRLSRGLPPPVLALRGLDAALRELAGRTPGATVRGSAGERIAPAVCVAAYFAVAEGLTNALRHSGAGEIEVAVERHNGSLRIDVRDDGCGGATLGAGSGLRGLAGRLKAQDGRLEIRSPAGAGTLLRIELPLGQDHGER
jgi:signal transduction histidine kinase